MSKAGRKMTAQKSRKQNLNQQMTARVLPLRSHNLQESVATIGYQYPGVTSGISIQGTYDYLKERLGGKGAGLVEMAKLKIPVPPAFNLSTSLCQLYLQRQNLPEPVIKQTRLALIGLEKFLKKRFGSTEHPLLISVRSGARISMPGMMDTILNLGLNREITQHLSKRFPDRARFWWDCYRRLIQMFSNVVLQVEHAQFERILQHWRTKEKVKADSDLSVSALQMICKEYENLVENADKKFPQDPWEQLLHAIEAVFRSWNTERAIHYRKLTNIPEDWGTSVTVQAMVFGNLNDKSATGVVFTRDPSTGERKLYGEYLINAQGEDVVAGIRTPRPIHQMKKELPEAASELVKALDRLEKHFNEVQDIEFTIENERLFILQTRTAKRSAQAALQNAFQFVQEKRLKKEAALERVSYDQVKQLLHPTLKATSEKPFVRGLPASPGACSGRVAFDPETALAFARAQQKVILVRQETSPEDIMGMSVSEGILTSTGGMTSHAAVVGRGMGKTCVVGCSELHVDEQNHRAEAFGITIEEGSLITLNGSTGDVYVGELPTEPVTWGDTARKFFQWTDEVASMPVLANADTPDQARLARELGAQGIGLCRTEHMFFDKERIRNFRRMILSESVEQREELAAELLAYQKSDFLQIFREMKDLSVCVRLLDPPLHEFLPKLDDQDEIKVLADSLRIPAGRLVQRIHQLHEVNPMLGHRGCRLGITFPEIYEMQVQALAESLFDLIREGKKVALKIMIPLVMSTEELSYLLRRLKNVFERSLSNADPTPEAQQLRKLRSLVKWGTMIELPRACVIGAEIARLVDFISFGTNDLTQTTLGISRDDATKFIPTYLDKQLFRKDPFETLDVQGVGKLIEWAVRESRAANATLEVGICGEHGGDPESIEFFRRIQFNNVSCSPFRVPIARLAAACAEQKQKNK